MTESDFIIYKYMYLLIITMCVNHWKIGSHIETYNMDKIYDLKIFTSIANYSTRKITHMPKIVKLSHYLTTLDFFLL